MLFKAMQFAIRSTFSARIYEHPFNQALCHGTLPISYFYHFLEQDKHYLCQFSKSLECVAKRANNNQHRDILMQLSHDAFKTQEKLHDKYLLMNGNLTFFPKKRPHFKYKNEAIKSYMYHIHHTAEIEPIPVAIASLIPCFYIYSTLGSYMQQKGISPDNPYRLWIESYSNNTFLTSTKLIINILNELTSTETETIHYNHCMNAFTKSVLFEIGFWDSIYHEISCVESYQHTLFY